MTKDSLRNIVATATISACVILPTVNAQAQRYGSQNDLGHEVSSLHQTVRATNARLQQLEKEVAALGRKIGSTGGSSSHVSYTGGNTKYTPPSGNGFVHRVERGETLSSISRRYGVGIDRLASSNQLVDPHRLKIGQEIFVPGASGGGGSTRLQTPAPPQYLPGNPSTQSGGSYTVRSGDTLSSIARRHGTSVGAIIRNNAIDNPDALHIGQVLSISGASGHSPAPEKYSTPSSNHTPSQPTNSPIYDEPVASTGEVEAPEGYGWYQVVRGDTLHSIGQDFSITTKELMRLNELKSYELQPDQYLLVPVDDESLYES